MGQCTPIGTEAVEVACKNGYEHLPHAVSVDRMSVMFVRFLRLLKLPHSSTRKRNDACVIVYFCSMLLSIMRISPQSWQRCDAAQQEGEEG